MAQSRKNQSTGLRFGTACKAALLCGFIVVSCVGYVWQKRQIGELSKQYLEKDARLKKLRDENMKLRNELGMLRSPQILDQRVKELKLGLGLPQVGQVWRLPEPAIEPSEAAAAPQARTGLTGSLVSR